MTGAVAKLPQLLLAYDKEVKAWSAKCASLESKLGSLQAGNYSLKQNLDSARASVNNLKRAVEESKANVNAQIRLAKSAKARTKEVEAELYNRHKLDAVELNKMMIPKSYDMLPNIYGLQ